MTTDPPKQENASNEPWVEVYSSREFPDWLAEHRVSIAFTTYQSAKLFLLGLDTQHKLTVFERTFNRCMGLWTDGQSLWISTLFQIWRLENALRPGELHAGNDRLYIPRIGYTTGDLDVHDLAVEADGRVIFVNSKFNCLATLSERDSFSPIWKPPFVDRLVPEDRCHLNGLALANGKTRYVTAVSRSNAVDGWRDRRRDGGLLLDVTQNTEIVSGLSMPHSPRVYRDQIWLLNSGTGHLGSVDVKKGTFEPLAFCPGYVRGLSFVSDYAVVGLSRPRHEKTFVGLQLDETLASSGTEARCGLHIIDLKTGNCAHWVRVEGMVSELYDVAVLPGVVRPMALGLKTDEIERILSIGPPSPL